jgi:hypothetical protein
MYPFYRHPNMVGSIPKANPNKMVDDDTPLT